VTLQGEVLQEAHLVVRSADHDRFAAPTDTGLATARRLLRRAAHGLHVAGLDALSARAAALAARVTDAADRDAVARDTRGLGRRIRRSGLLWMLRGVGTIEGVDAAERWRNRLDTIAAGLDGDVAVVPTPPAQPTVEDALVGMTLSDVMATLASVDALQTRPAAAGAA
jgi:hypothetical protein